MTDELMWAKHPDPTPEQLERMAREFSAYLVDTALANGTCIGFDMHAEGDGNRDLVVSIRVRHNSANQGRE